MGREWQHKEKGATRHLDNSLILLVPPARFERAAHGLGILFFTFPKPSLRFRNKSKTA